MIEGQATGIRKHADISTVHVKNYAQGAIIPLPPQDYLEEHLQKAQALGMSESFCKAMRYASKHNAGLLSLDADADIAEDPELDTHGWDAEESPGPGM